MPDADAPLDGHCDQSGVPCLSKLPRTSICCLQLEIKADLLSSHWRRPPGVETAVYSVPARPQCQAGRGLQWGCLALLQKTRWRSSKFVSSTPVLLQVVRPGTIHRSAWVKMSFTACDACSVGPSGSADAPVCRSKLGVWVGASHSSRWLRY